MKGYFHTLATPTQGVHTLLNGDTVHCSCARCHKVYPKIAGFIADRLNTEPGMAMFFTEDGRLATYCEDCWPIVNGIKEPVPDTILSTQLM